MYFYWQKSLACPFTYQIIAYPFSFISWVHKEAFDLTGHLTEMKSVCIGMNQP